MKAVFVSKSITIPDGVDIGVDSGKVVVKGELGIIERDFSSTPVVVSLKNGALKLEAHWPNKKSVAILGTVRSIIQNMIKGVTKGFTYKLKIVFAHFPMSVKVKGNQVVIENFSGERRPRIAMIRKNVDVIVENDDVIVRGIDIQDVSQTAANIQQATRIKKKDSRVFLDGIYVFEKEEGIENAE